MSIDWVGIVWFLISPFGSGLIVGCLSGLLFFFAWVETKRRSYNHNATINRYTSVYAQSLITSTPNPEVVLGEGEVIRAYRQCSVEADGRITSQYDGGVWEYKEGLGYERDFNCTAGHTTVDPNCLCGIYALRGPQEGWFEVLLWGRVLEGSSGYRAEHARLVAVMEHRQQEWVKRIIHFTAIVPKASLPTMNGYSMTIDEEPSEGPSSTMVPNLPVIPYEEWSKNIPTGSIESGYAQSLMNPIAATSTYINFTGGFGNIQIH